jgi:hypothetical protein
VVLLAVPLHDLLVQLLLLEGCDVLDGRLRVMLGLLEESDARDLDRVCVLRSSGLTLHLCVFQVVP